ncbi:unnamed protein product, partial [Ectocarpus sp. 8 AP-2014]
PFCARARGERVSSFGARSSGNGPAWILGLFPSDAWPRPPRQSFLYDRLLLLLVLPFRRPASRHTAFLGAPLAAHPDPECHRHRRRRRLDVFRCWRRSPRRDGGTR